MQTRPTIWIVDDDSDDQYLLHMAFRSIQPTISIKQLNDGEELVPHLQQAAELPKLILLDLNMPGKNGFQTLEELRSLPAYQQLPVVVLTTSSAEEDREKSLRFGANGFLTKPPKHDDMVQMLLQLTDDWGLN